MSVTSLLVCAVACSGAVLGALWAGSVWRIMAERMSRTVHLQLHQDGVVPGNTMVKTGILTLVLASETQEACHLHVWDSEIELTSPKIRPGQKRDWIVQLDPGMYSMSSCTSDRKQQYPPSFLRVVPAPV